MEYDINLLRPLVGSRSWQVAVTPEENTFRRSYIRAVFGLFEALIEQHKRLLLDLHEHYNITLTDLTRKEFLEDRRYIPIEEKIRKVLCASGLALGPSSKITLQNPAEHDWLLFRKTVNLRNWLTHPKSSDDCLFDGIDLDLIDSAHEWSEKLHNELVKIERELLARTKQSYNDFHTL